MFEIGMKVVMRSRDGVSLTEIIKITPKGGVRVKSHPSILFWDGNAKTGPYSYYHIYQATEEDVAIFKRHNIIKKIKKFDWSLLNTDELEKLLTSITLAGARAAVKETIK